MTLFLFSPPRFNLTVGSTMHVMGQDKTVIDTSDIPTDDDTSESISRPDSGWSGGAWLVSAERWAWVCRVVGAMVRGARFC